MNALNKKKKVTASWLYNWEEKTKLLRNTYKLNWSKIFINGNFTKGVKIEVKQTKENDKNIK